MMSGCPFSSRRGFLGSAGALIAAAGTARASADTPADKGINRSGQAEGRALIEPFWGEHQGGILTARQNHTYFAAFDVVTDKKAEIAGLLRSWTEASARLTQGLAIDPVKPVQAADHAAASGSNYDQAPTTALPDSGETAGLAPARLTLTFGFGPGLFHHQGQDRFGLAARRPAPLIDLPTFNGDQLDPARTGGDLSVQACADDPQVAFHAVRQLARLARGVAVLRWTQGGFTPNAAAQDTPRNLMGFRDGTQNPLARRPEEASAAGAVPNPVNHDEVVWAGDEGPAWMRGGSYLVARRIRIALEHWDDTDTDFQEQTIGRRKSSGAPLTGRNEFDALDLDASDKDGNPVVAMNAHVRMAAAASNGGAQILRRAFSYNDGVNTVAERWPPWRQGLEYDAGLFFIAYQRDPRTGFVKMFTPMSKLDALNQFTTHVGGGLFAVPPGAREGEFVGQALFA